MGAKTTRPRRWQERMATAGDESGELTVAYDRLRSAASRQFRPQRDRAARERASSAARVALASAAAYLSEQAEDLEALEGSDAR